MGQEESKPKLLGQGTYGCAYSPPMKCDPESACPKTDPKCTEGVSKLMRRVDAIKEHAETAQLKIDPTFKYHLPPPTMCKASKKSLAKSEKCTSESYEYPDLKLGDKLNESTLLIYEHGGTTVENLAKFIFNEGSFVKYLEGFENIFYAVKDMSEHGVVHGDIKPDNIVMGDGDFKLIDFGLSWSKVPYLNSIYVLYPPEFWLLGSTNGDSGALTKIYAQITKILKALPPTHPYVLYSGGDAKKLYQQIKEKADVYSLGQCMSWIGEDMSASPYARAVEFTKSDIFISLIKKMKHNNITKRISAEDALDEYRKLLAYVKSGKVLTQYKALTTLATPVARVSSRPKKGFEGQVVAGKALPLYMGYLSKKMPPSKGGMSVSELRKISDALGIKRDRKHGTKEKMVESIQMALTF